MEVLFSLFNFEPIFWTCFAKSQPAHQSHSANINIDHKILVANLADLEIIYPNNTDTVGVNDLFIQNVSDQEKIRI